MQKKVMFQLYLELRQLNYIEKLSKETGRSRASIVREMIDYYKKEAKHNEKS